MSTNTLERLLSTFLQGAMAFLVPASTAGGSDVLLLYLSATYKGNLTLNGDDGNCKFYFRGRNARDSHAS